MDTRRFFIILIAVLTAIVLVNRLLLCFSYYTDLGGVEETFVYYAQRFAAGLDIYTDPEQPPFYINQYSPLSTVVIGSVYRALGLNLTVEVHSLFVVGRLLQLIFNLLQCWLVFCVLRRVFNVQNSLSLIGACLVFLFFFSHNYAIRPDSLKSLFITAFFTALVFYLQKGGMKLLVVSGVLIALAVLTKQDALAFYIVTVAWLVIIRQYKAAIPIAIIGGLSIIGAITWCFFTSGNLFYVNVVKGLSQGVNFNYFLQLLPYVVPHTIVLLVILFLLIKWKEYLKQGELNGPQILLLAALVFGFELVSALKWGASPVYFSDFVTLTIIGAVVTAVSTDVNKLPKLIWGYLSFWVLLLLVFEYTNGVSKKWFSKSENTALSEVYAEKVNVTRKIRAWEKDKMMFSVDKGFINHNFDLCIFPTYEAEFFELMNENGISDDRNNLPKIIFTYERAAEMVSNRQVTYVITRASGKVPRFLGLDYLNYQEVLVGSSIKVYQLK